MLKQFRAYLYMAITAHQIGQAKKLEAMPGPQMRDYCHMLAKLPGNTLACELSAAVGAVLEQLDAAAMDFYRPIFQKKVEDPAKQAELETILEQLDLALAFILRRVRTMANIRADVTKSTDLLCDATSMTIGNGVDAARLIRYGEKYFPEISRLDDGSIDGGGFPGKFAWDAYQRVDALDRLADEFPDQIRMETCQMHAWPMLVGRCWCTGTRIIVVGFKNSRSFLNSVRNIRPTRVKALGSDLTHRWFAILNRSSVGCIRFVITKTRTGNLKPSKKKTNSSGDSGGSGRKLRRAKIFLRCCVSRACCHR